MSLTFYYHPLASFCWKALIALYEKSVSFRPLLVDLGSKESRDAFAQVWPIAKFPVLRDDARNQTVPESTVIVEYLDQYYPGGPRLIPADPELAWQVRLHDRFFDLYVHVPMQKIVTDRIRPAGRNDPHGVEEARAQLQVSYGMLEASIGSQWFTGADFSLVDCAASPALFYANKVAPLAPSFPKTAAYLDRLMKRPSFARVLEEAEPYFKYFPG